jgi:hypothetical protein
MIKAVRRRKYYECHEECHEGYGEQSEPTVPYLADMNGTRRDELYGLCRDEGITVSPCPFLHEPVMLKFSKSQLNA